MAFWSSEKIKQRANGGSLIRPYDPKRVKHAAYELSVGPERYVTSDPSGTKQQLDSNEQAVIPPGQVALLLTEEEISIPNDTIALISIKVSIKFRGLVNVSGFHVDPGFKGRLKFAVYNAGSQTVILSRHQPAFLIWFSDLDRVTEDPYNGNYFGQVDITSLDVMQLQGEIASPQQLTKRIDDLQSSLDNVKSTVSVFVGVVVALVVGIVLAALRVLPIPVTTIPTSQQSVASPIASSPPSNASAPGASVTPEKKKGAVVSEKKGSGSK